MSRSAASLPRVYRTLLSSELAAAANYRAQLLVGALGWVVPLAMLALWRGAGGGEPIEGITPGQLTTYYLVVLVATGLSPIGALIFGLSELVYTGRLSSLLLRPVHPLHGLVAQNTAEALTRLLIVVPATLALGFLLDAEVTGSAAAWVLAVVVMVVGMTAVGYVGALTGAMALWITKAQAIQGIAMGFEWLLGGLLAPVALFPGWAEAIARVSPFWLALGAPAELVAGMLAVEDGMVSVGIGAVWILMLHIVFRRVWARGMVQYEAVGA